LIVITDDNCLHGGYGKAVDGYGAILIASDFCLVTLNVKDINNTTFKGEGELSHGILLD
jgi:hypothetical protein